MSNAHALTRNSLLYHGRKRVVCISVHVLRHCIGYVTLGQVWVSSKHQEQSRVLCHSANVGTQMRTSRSLSSSILQGRRGYHGSRGTLSHRLFFYPLNAIYVLNRLHIGHFYLTHSFVLRREEAPVCVACNAVITVKHTLNIH